MREIDEIDSDFESDFKEIRQMPFLGSKAQQISNPNKKQQESKSIAQMREAEAQIAEACKMLKNITLGMDASVHEVMPIFREIEQSFDESITILRESNILLMEEALHEANMRIFLGLRWKADLSDNLKRIKQTDRDNPEHPINSKLRRKLLSS